MSGKTKDPKETLSPELVKRIEAEGERLKQQYIWRKMNDERHSKWRRENASYIDDVQRGCFDD